MNNRQKLYRAVNFIIGSLFFIAAIIFITNSLVDLTGFATLENLPKEKSSVIGSVLLLSSAIIFKLSLRKVKEGQAAMEFMMTYGWTILALIITLGALSYISLFNKDNLSPSGIYLEPPFYSDSGTGDQDSIDISIRNNADTGYIITKIDIPGCGSYTDQFTIPSGKKQELSIQCTTPLDPKTKFKGDVQITYHSSDSLLDKQIIGQINVYIKQGTGVRLSPNGQNNQNNQNTQTCGNNMREGTEVCDGTNLNGKTCSSQEICSTQNTCPYIGPGLKCKQDCSGFDTSQCSLTECSDGLDNDQDKSIDFPADKGCTDQNDKDEKDPSVQGGELGGLQE